MRTTIVLAVFVLGACASGPTPPEWQSRSGDAMEKFSRHYLEGDSRLAERSFSEARKAVASTGRPELVARAELVRCALGTAALDGDACADFESMRSAATADDQAYADFVTGHGQAKDASRLPSQYHAVAGAHDQAARSNAMQQIEDPVSRLIAAGALFRRAQLSPEGVAAAIDTASAQGYRRPLLAYLNVQAKSAEAAGDAAALKAIEKRIDLVYQSMPGTRP